MNQNKLINFIKNTFSQYQGVEALYLKGSFARETDDAYSDVDCYCLVDEELYEDILNQRYEILKLYDTVLYHSYVNFKYAQIIMIYEGNLHLDFYLLKAVEREGYDPIKVIYDPKHLLESYQQITYKEDTSQHLSEAIYTLSELDIAIKRQDHLWAIRLITHILADLSLILSKLYSNKPVYHMKGLYHHLPPDLKEQIDQVLCSLSKDTLKQCQKYIVLLVKSVYDIVGDKDLDDGLLRYMMR